MIKRSLRATFPDFMMKLLRERGIENKMRNIKLVIEYDGKDFNGWQKQPNKLNIQGTIEKAIESLTKEPVELMASGRTDAGVHAIRTSG